MLVNELIDAGVRGRLPSDYGNIENAYLPPGTPPLAAVQSAAAGNLGDNSPIHAVDLKVSDAWPGLHAPITTITGDGTLRNIDIITLPVRMINPPAPPGFKGIVTDTFDVGQPAVATKVDDVPVTAVTADQNTAAVAPPAIETVFGNGWVLLAGALLVLGFMGWLE